MASVDLDQFVQLCHEAVILTALFLQLAAQLLEAGLQVAFLACGRRIGISTHKVNNFPDYRHGINPLTNRILVIVIPWIHLTDTKVSGLDASIPCRRG